ncbi:MAG: rhomboid family intramembrane serine protease, partial [candidate division WOR-3 bacterium]
MLPLKDINPSKRKPLITYSLITINGLVFLYELLLGKNLYNFFLRFGFIPFNFTLFLKGGTDYPYFLNIITSMFIHGGWAHIIGNMWFLLIFGDNVEDTLGKLNYIILYLTSGVFAVLAQYIITPISKIPLIGASGAISGILGAYLVLFPNAKILSLIP